MRKLAAAAFLLGLFGVIGVAEAADKDDPTGTWKWTTKTEKAEIEYTLKLELKDGKLTGTRTGKGTPVDDKVKIKVPDAKVENGKFEKGELSFTISNTAGTKTYTSKFGGKVEGDTIKGQITTATGNKIDWEAKRVKEAKKE